MLRPKRGEYAASRRIGARLQRPGRGRTLVCEEEDLMRRLAALRGEDVAPQEEGFFSKIRSAFK